MLGWISAAAIFSYYVQPIILRTIFWVRQTVSTGTLETWLNNFHIADIIGLVGSLLGMGILRTVEKKTNA